MPFAGMIIACYGNSIVEPKTREEMLKKVAELEQAAFLPETIKAGLTQTVLSEVAYWRHRMIFSL